MNLSLNEIEAIAKRASKGAGYGWGLAEEAAKATRWLCTCGVDGVVSLTQLLEMEFPKSMHQHCPSQIDGPWQGAQLLCPLTTGALLSDCAERLKIGSISMHNVAHPTLLIPFAALASLQLSQVIELRADDEKCYTNGAFCELPTQLKNTAEEIIVSLSTHLMSSQTLKTRATPHPQSWETLKRWAHLTYAPATDASRLLGAGAGLTDND